MHILVYLFVFILKHAHNAKIGAKPIFMNVAMMPDDKVKSIIQGSKTYDTNDFGFSNWETETNFNYNGLIGEPTHFIIENNLGAAGMAAIVTIGTTIFNTNTFDYWEYPKGFGHCPGLNYDSKSINGATIKYIALLSAQKIDYDFSFKSPTDQTYCSTKTPDGKIAISYVKKDKQMPIDIENVIYPIDTKDPYIKVTSQTHGEFRSDDKAISLNQPYLLDSLTYYSNEYKTDVFDYYCISENKSSQKCQHTIVVCHERCKTCRDNGSNSGTEPTLDDQQCIECDDTAGFAPIKHNAGNCLLINDTDNNLIYDPDSKEFNCHPKCADCDKTPSNNHCKCNNSTEYQLEGANQSICYTKEDNKDYYVDFTENILKQCYVTCTECKGKGNEYSHNCTKCTSPFRLKDGNCLCNDFLFYDEFNKPTCISRCIDDLPYYIPELNQCVDNCPPDLLFPNYLHCKKYCPSPNHLYKDECLSSCFPKTITTDPFVYFNHYAWECIDFINKNILDYYELDRYIEGKDFSLQVYDLNQPLKEVGNLTSMNFTLCEKELRNNHSIPLSDSIIIAKFDIYRSQSSINQIEYNAYDKHGELLDISVCDGININVSYPIQSNNNEINYTYSEKVYFDTGIDILNPKLSFYNDYCFPFYIDDADLTLSNRRTLMYYNISLCEDSCDYIGFNYTTMKAQCSCSTKPFLSLDPSDFMIPKFNPEFLRTSLLISKCYTIFFNIKHIKASFPFYFFGSMSVMLIIILIHQLIRENYILYSLFQSFEAKYRNQKKNQLLLFLQKSTPSLLLHPYCHRNTNRANHHHNLNLCIPQVLSSDAIQECINYDQEALSIELDYRLTIIIHKEKNLWLLFIDLIIDKHPLLCLFFSKHKCSLWSINATKLILYLSMSLCFNAMLFTDDIISYKYANQHYDMQSLFLNTVNTTAVSLMLYSLCNRMLLYHEFFPQFQLDVEQRKTYYSLGMKQAKQMKQLLIIYWLLVIICVCWCWYYCTIFNVVYHKTFMMVVYTWLWSIGNKLIVLSVVVLILSKLKYNSLIDPSIDIYDFVETVEKWI